MATKSIPRSDPNGTRVLIVDDSPMVRAGLRRLLDADPGLRVLKEARSCYEATEMIGRLRPDVVLMGKSALSRVGVEATRQIKKCKPDVRVLFYGNGSGWGKEAVKAGAELVVEERGGERELLRSLKDPIAKLRPLAGTAKPKRKESSWLGLGLQVMVLFMAALMLVLIIAYPGVAFPVIGLVFGFVFFSYGLKYYLSLAMVLLASGRSNGNGNGSKNGVKNGNGWGANGLSKSNGGSGSLPRRPFVSIHLPLYNEAAVVDRLLNACTTLEYDNYEVIVADDSTDKTKDLLRRNWGNHPKVKISHRNNRSGFKGGALQEALKRTDPRAEFIAVFDADFVPPPDILSQFLSYFYGVNGANGKHGKSRDEEEPSLVDDRLAVVQGYQWHILNASENWITRGVRAEYAGSYVVERSSQELTGAMKMISGSVFMVRADVLRQVGWRTSITEDWELTLRLYLEGYKVLYTPFIQAPAECVSNFRQLARQRMRWAEGHTYNVRKYFLQVLTSPNISLWEKLEFVYYGPYYLQSAFFMLGTAAWLISDLILKQPVPFWGAMLGWSLVFTNMFSLMCMNLAGLFLERGVRRGWSGVVSAIVLTYLLVPYQAYAALKALIEPREGGWHRTQKTGVITEMFDRLGFGKRLRRLMPKRTQTGAALAAPIARIVARLPEPLRDLGWLTRRLPGPARRVLRGTRPNLGWVSALVTGLVGLVILLRSVPVAGAGADIFYLGEARAEGAAPAGLAMGGDLEDAAAGLRFDHVGQVAYWYTEVNGNGEGNDLSIASGAYSLRMYFSELPEAAEEAAAVEIAVSVYRTRPDGSVPQPIARSQVVRIDSGSPPEYTLEIGEGAEQNWRASEPRRLRVMMVVTAVHGEGSFTLANGSASHASYLDTPKASLPGVSLSLALGMISIPLLTGTLTRKRRLVTRVVALVLSIVAVLAILAQQVYVVSANPDSFYLRDTTTNGAAPAGEDMNSTQGSSEDLLVFNNASDQAYWYTALTYPEGGDDATIAAGNYTLNMYFDQLPSLPADWYSADFDYRKKITLDSGLVTADQTNFPVLISLASDADLASKARNDGLDLLVTSSNGTTKYSHEVEYFNSATGELALWVKIPSLSSTVDTELYLYYGYASSPDQQNVSDVWSNGFLEVWHLNETSGNHADSTSNNYVGTPNGSVTQNASGKVDGADEFVGPSTTTYITLADGDLGNNASFTISAWFNLDTSTQWTGIVTKGRETGNDWVGLWANGTQFTFGWDWQGGKGGNVDDTTDTLATGGTTWNYGVGTFDGIDRRLYHDAVLHSSFPDPGSYNGLTGSSTSIGNDRADASANSFDGFIDEVRFASVARPLDWIQTEYNNQANQGVGVGKFITALASEEAAPRVQITASVYHTQGDGSSPVEIVTSSVTNIRANTANPFALTIGNDAVGQTFTASDPQRLRVFVDVTTIYAGGSFTLAYDSGANPTNLDTPSIVVPDWGLAFLIVVPLIPYLMAAFWRHRRMGMQLINLLVVAALALGFFANQITPVRASPDTFYLHDSSASSIVDLVEMETGSSWESTSVATSASLTAVNNQLYLASISFKNGNQSVTQVTGLGLTWTLVKAQCGGREQTRAEVWKAQGTTTGDGVVTATLSGSPWNSVIAVARYSGMDASNPIGATASANSNGVDGACSGGTDGTNPTVDLTTTVSDSLVFGAFALGSRTFTAGGGYTEQVEIHEDTGGSAGDDAGVAVEDKLVETASTVAVDGTVDLDLDWVVVAVEVKAASLNPAGKEMNIIQGSAGSTMTFDTPGQSAYWYVDDTWPTGAGDAAIAAGNYTLNMYFNQLPATWYDSDWGYRKKISIDSSKVSGTSNLAYFPVLVSFSRFYDTVTSQISTGTDDAEESLSSGAMTLTSTDLELIREGASNAQEVGLRFQGITIPQGATISRAYIQFTAGGVDSEATSLTIYGEASANAATFTTTTNDITNRTKTSASVAWNNIPAWGTSGDQTINQRTLDISPVIQEIVNNVGWSSGNSLAIIITGSGRRNAESFDKSGGTPGVLVIDYVSSDIRDAALKDTSNGGKVGQSDGGDILFTASDGTTKLHHEISAYDNTTGELVAWVEVASVSYSTNTDIYMYYGNTVPALPDQWNINGTWDENGANNYRGVWHVQEDPGPGGAGDIKDSTSYANHGTAQASMTSADQIAGKVGSSIEFDGLDDQVQITGAASLDITSAISIEAWFFQHVDMNGNSWTAIRKNTNSYLLEPGDSGENYWEFDLRLTTGYKRVVATAPLAIRGWHHIVGTYDGATMKIYIDGTQSNTNPQTDPIQTQVGDMFFGGDSAFSEHFYGIIDEVLLSSVARPAGWITTEYNNQSSPSTFYSVFSEESAPKVDITVSVHHTKGDGTDPQLIASGSTTIDSTDTVEPVVVSLGSGIQQTFTLDNPRRLRVQVYVDSIANSGSFILDYDGTCATNKCTNLDTPVVTVPEGALLFGFAASLIPLLVWKLRERRRCRREKTFQFAPN